MVPQIEEPNIWIRQIDGIKNQIIKIFKHNKKLNLKFVIKKLNP